ncbi:MAG: hypothetical protein ABEL76_09585 [Bradymonadaceae bacterium]
MTDEPNDPYYATTMELPEEFDGYDVQGDTTPGEKTLSELSHINFFVGANNSGKSRFTRQMFSNLESIQYEFTHFHLKNESRNILGQLRKLD